MSFPPVEPLTLSLGAFLAGLAMLALVLGCAALAGERLMRAYTPQPRGLEALLAWSLWTTVALIAAHLAPLTLGVLSRATAIAGSLLVAAGAVAIARRRGGAGAASLRDRGAARWSDAAGPLAVRVMAVAGALLVAGAALALLRNQAGFPLVGTDALNFQIPVPARWMQSGSLWQLDQFFPDYSNATYPHHGNVLLVAVMLPFDSAFLARLVAVPYGALAFAAIYACAREVGADRGWALLAAAVVMAVPLFAKVTLEGAQNDTQMYAFLAAGGLFLLRHRRTGAGADLLLAGLGLGLCLGTKWYALTTLPPLLAVWAGAQLLARVPLRRVITDARGAVRHDPRGRRHLARAQLGRGRQSAVPAAAAGAQLPPRRHPRAGELVAGRLHAAVGRPRLVHLPAAAVRRLHRRARLPAGARARPRDRRCGVATRLRGARGRRRRRHHARRLLGDALQRARPQGRAGAGFRVDPLRDAGARDRRRHARLAGQPAAAGHPLRRCAAAGAGRDRGRPGAVPAGAVDSVDRRADARRRRRRLAGPAAVAPFRRGRATRRRAGGRRRGPARLHRRRRPDAPPRQRPHLRRL